MLGLRDESVYSELAKDNNPKKVEFNGNQPRASEATYQLQSNKAVSARGPGQYRP